MSMAQGFNFSPTSPFQNLMTSGQYQQPPWMTPNPVVNPAPPNINPLTYFNNQQLMESPPQHHQWPNNNYATNATTTPTPTWTLGTGTVVGGQGQTQNQNQPFIVQPIFIPVLQPIFMNPQGQGQGQSPYSDIYSLKLGDQVSTSLTTIPSSNCSQDSLFPQGNFLPASYLASNLSSIPSLRGEGPSLLTPNPEFKSPLFHWSNQGSGDSSRRSLNVPLALNETVLSTLTRPPGEETLPSSVIRRNKALEQDNSVSLAILEKISDQLQAIPEAIRQLDNERMQTLFGPSPRRNYSYSSGECKNNGPTPRLDPDIDPILGSSYFEQVQNPIRLRNRKDWLRGSLETKNEPFKMTESRTSENSKIPVIFSGLKRLDPRVIQEFHRHPTSSSSRLRFLSGPGSRCRVKLSKPEHYLNPDLRTMDSLYSPSSGSCLVTDLLVGHKDWGEVRFPGTLDVAGLDLDSILEFKPGELLLYQNVVKPMYGQGLNRRAVVTLNQVYPRMIHQGEYFMEKLRRSCRRFGGKFVSYDALRGKWTFEIQNEQE